MTTHCPPLTAPSPAPVAPRTARVREGFGGYAMVGALAAGLAGFVTHARGDGPLVVAMTVGIVFFGALVVQFVLSVLFSLCVQVLRLLAPIALLLLIGHLCDWHWADRALHWLRVAGGEAVEAAGQAYAAWQVR